MGLSNPLLQTFRTPYQSVPFEQIKKEHFLPALEESVVMAKKEVQNIIDCNEPPHFKNTIVALEKAGNLVDSVATIFFNLNSVVTDKKLQQIARDFAPKLSDFSNDIILNEPLFRKVQKVYQSKESITLDIESKTLLEKTYKNFTRNGANLEASSKEKLREIDRQLAGYSLKFGENVLREMQTYELHITDEKDLEGLPQSAKQMARQMAEQKNKKGFVFTLDYPSYVPLVTYVKNRDVRKQITLAFLSRAFKKDALNNVENLFNIVKLRKQRANLLGYQTYADFVLEDRMASSVDEVNSFLQNLKIKAKSAAKKEFELLKQKALEDGISQIQKWDSAYYSERLRKEKFDFDKELLKPYFQLENVLSGVFELSYKLFGLSFEKCSDVQVYHPEVQVYKVLDKERNFKALLYLDFFPRKDKRDGAWMTSYKRQYKDVLGNHRPHVSVVCNFTRPTEDIPSLLTFEEVTTLFHEFGHALHGMVANTVYASLSGTNVSWDFVELPSQILENWCYQEQVLKTFARHYKTKEMIPQKFIENIKKAANFLQGLQTLRQVGLGLLDMAWHAYNKPIKDIKDIENQILGDTDFYPQIENSCVSTSFSHIFQGGYASGYYSYKWSEVLSADAFRHFEEKGILDKQIAKRFRECILSKGGTQKPMDLYVKFAGRKPTSDALLKKLGFI